jgi:hypothetical protein
LKANCEVFSRRQIIKTAKDLGYSKEIIDRLKVAKNEIELERIMCDARVRECEKHFVK